jgi:hypothetical protein
MTSLIMTVAMLGQTPASNRDAEGQFGQTPAPEVAPRKSHLTDADVKVLSDLAAQVGEGWPASASPKVRKESPPFRSYADRKAIQRGRIAAMERAEAEAQRRYAIEAQRQYERMLPYMLEQQRQQLERMSAMERNQALHRMAAAAESEAQTYQWRMWQLQNRAR